MLCPLCRKSDSKVLDSRDQNSYVKRRRECLKCRYRFSTYERLEPPKIIVIKRDQHRENYCRSKLLKGVSLALEKRPFLISQIEQIVTEIEQNIIKIGKKEIPTKIIGDIVIEKLKNTDEVAYLRFVSVYKKFGSAKKFQKEVEKFVD